MTELTIIGAALSPFVRKVRLLLGEKQLEYSLEPLNPFDVPANFRSISPLGRIPVLRHGDFVLNDSSAICAYLDAEFPSNRLFPVEPKSLGRALWYEELADTDFGQAIGYVFRREFVFPYVLGETPDDDELAAHATAVSESIPYWFDYLEAELNSRTYAVDDRFSIADVALCVPLTTYQYCETGPRLADWSRLAAYARRCLARPAFETVIGSERKIIESLRSRNAGARLEDRRYRRPLLDSRATIVDGYLKW